MRLHSNVIESSDVYRAASAAGSGVSVTCTPHGSRKRSHAFEVTLTGTSNRRPNSGTSAPQSDTYAATWDEWGMFFAALYRLDPEMISGSDYADAATFHYRTGDRFEILTPADQHRSHRWQFEGTPREQSCTGCDAVQRW